MTTRLRQWVLICAMISLLAGPVPGEEPTEWTSVGLGGGGGIFVAVSSPHDPNLMFCASDMSGVYRSTDGGRTWRMLPWRQLSSAITMPVVFHPTDPNTLYCVPGTWAQPVLKVSRDKGQTWQPLTDETPWQHATPQATRLAIDPTGKVLLVSSEAGIYRSDDNGQSWTRASGLDQRAVGFFFEPTELNQGAWYAATPNTVLFSRDNGQTWQPCPTQPPGKAVQAFCGGADVKTGRVALYVSLPSQLVEGKYAGGIWRSDDRGATWQSAMGKGINTSVGPHGQARRKLAEYPFLDMAENQTQTVYAYCYGNGDEPPYHDTVFRTDDGGQTWRAVEYFRPGYKGHNVELSWIRLDRGHGGRKTGFSVNPRNGNHVAYTDTMELYLTDDGGATWRKAFSRCVEPSPAAGKRWQSTGLEVTTTWRFKFDPHDSNRVYICYTDIGFARSLDRGATWYWSPAGSPWQNTFYDLTFDPARPGVLYAACAYEHDIPSWKMAGRLYGGGGVCVSTDYGKTWRPIASGLPKLGACTAVALDPTSPTDRRTLYAAFYGGGIFKSVDGGENWRARNKGLPVEHNDHFTDLKRHTDGSLFALCGGKRLARYNPSPHTGLFRSVDGGDSWTDVTAGLTLYLPFGFDVHPTDSRIIYLCVSAVPRRHDEAGVYKTIDGGKTWKKLGIAWPEGGPSYVHAKYPSIDPYNPKRVWVSTATHGTLVTTDGGDTWRQVESIPFRGVNRITVDPRDHQTLWVTTFGGGVWKGAVRP